MLPMPLAGVSGAKGTRMRGVPVRLVGGASRGVGIEGKLPFAVEVEPSGRSSCGRGYPCRPVKATLQFQSNGVTRTASVKKRTLARPGMGMAPLLIG